MLTSAQMRAARAYLDLSQKDLAAESGVSVPTIQRLEKGDRVVKANMDTLMKILAVFERSGLQLISDGETSLSGGRGLRLR